jgi:hypothetical protein
VFWICKYSPDPQNIEINGAILVEYGTGGTRLRFAYMVKKKKYIHKLLG